MGKLTASINTGLMCKKCGKWMPDTEKKIYDDSYTWEMIERQAPNVARVCQWCKDKIKEV